MFRYRGKNMKSLLHKIDSRFTQPILIREQNHGFEVVRSNNSITLN